MFKIYNDIIQLSQRIPVSFFRISLLHTSNTILFGTLRCTLSFSFFSFSTQRLVLAPAAAAAASAASATAPSMAPSSSAAAAAVVPAIPGVPVVAVFMACGKLTGQSQRRGDRLRLRLSYMPTAFLRFCGVDIFDIIYNESSF
jgi:hypothetical protein